MLNKKAIAALAAGATLVSGLAFATPSFAAEPQAPKKEECKPADAAKLAELKKAVHDAERKATKAGYDAEDAQDAYDKAVDQSKAEETVVKKYNETLKQVKDALVADTKAKAGTDQEAKDKAALALTQAKNAHDASKKAVEDYNASVTDVNLATYKVSVTDMKAGKDVDANSKELTFDTAKRADLLEAKAKKADADQALKEAQEKLAKAQCTTAPAPAPQPGPQPGPKPLPDVPDVPLFGLSDAQVRALTRLENTYVVLKKDQATFEFLHSEYLKSEANYKSALAKYQAADNEYIAAQQKANDLKAAGKEGTDAYKAARNEEQAAGARKTAAQASYDEAAADFQAKTVAVNAAADKFNADLVLYRNAYNNAVAVRANVSGFPKPDDVAKAPTFGVPNQVKEAAKKAEAKKGAVKKSGAAAPSGAKLDTKAAAAASAAPLSKTGVTVMFTALAASMLAGIGAAVRKFRH